MQRKLLIIILSLSIVILGGVSASALYIGDITYDYTLNGGNNYTFNFTVSNKSTAPDSGALDFFWIDFDADTYSLYSNLSWTNDNGWATSASEYDPAFGTLPATVTADDSFLGSGGGGIAAGASLGGFRVTFDYAGAFDPTAQSFSWGAEFGAFPTADGGYDILGSDDGKTRYVHGTPEPATLLFLGAGLIGLIGCTRRKKGE